MHAAEMRTAKIGWLVTGGLTLMTAVVLMFVMSTHDSRMPRDGGRGNPLDDLLAEIRRVDLNDADAIQRAKDKITAQKKLWRGSRIQEEVKQWLDKANGGGGLIKTRPSLKDKLATIETHLASAPTTEILGKDFAEVRDNELKAQAIDAGGELLERYNRTAKEVTKRHLDALRTAANAAASGTTVEALDPYGPYEDTICLLLHEAMANKDAEAVGFYRRLWNEICSEINAIVAKLFSEAYQNRVPWTNLLTDTSGWISAPSNSLMHTVGAGLTLINEPGELSAPSRLRYSPAQKWRDYVLEVELKLDSGALAFYTRIGDTMDTKEVPGFTVGTKNATIPIEYGKVYNLVISTIGNRLTVTGEGISPYAEDIEPTKSRKGEPGIIAHAGTTATITKVRARHLR